MLTIKQPRGWCKVCVCACDMTEREEVKNESVTVQSQVLVCINVFIGKLEVCVTVHLRMTSVNR